MHRNNEISINRKTFKDSINILIAGIRITIMNPDKTFALMSKNYIDHFEKADIVVNISDNETEEKNIIIDKIYNQYKIRKVAISLYKPQVENIILRKIAEQMPFYNAFLMHGAVVAYKKYAYMFVAPSGVGKTTRVKLWIKEYPDSIIINGDKPFIMITETSAMACGSPWCGKEGLNTNITVPLRAIFILERVDHNEENRIEEVSMTKSFPVLLQQTYRPSNYEAFMKTIELIISLQQTTKIYRFHSAPTAKSIRLAYETSTLVPDTNVVKRASN